MTEHILGMDIGGANLKYVCGDGTTLDRAFPLWKRHNELGEQLQRDLARFSGVHCWAVTMTGELADCYADRAEGVAHIVDCVSQLASRLGVRQVLFYAVGGDFRTAEQAKEDVDAIAASNWHAFASAIAQEIAGDGLLIDVGSTTTDIIPLRGGRVATDARSDFERLREGSLVYVGCRRTPICSLVETLTCNGHSVPVMNELFGTIDDAMLLLGHLAGQSECLDTADGRPRTAEHAVGRIARMLGLDRREISRSVADSLAEQVLVAAKKRIQAPIANLAAMTSGPWILGGHGQALVQVPEEHTTIDLRRTLGSDLSRCGPAWAVMRLARQEAL
ncbi:MAG: hydantoinase/oxoprolinase family protein [Planctomycetota bacterium]